ncbi:hypothetical protein NKR19_g10205 [Coniochaeta hoffmannii]|uniref:Uncharacterized protein n=1 Tax=Coniochaeta hoffmannii TaxID=91930 RepID=A0AA38R7S9_9PEZI|nr:hypothetical protein NKR19_g10205 [Coniochaeta hoffmannii]
MPPATRSAKRKADEAGLDEEHRPRRRPRARDERSYRGPARSTYLPPPRRITRQYASDHPGTVLHSLPMTGRLPEHNNKKKNNNSNNTPFHRPEPQPRPAQILCARPNWRAQFAQQLQAPPPGGPVVGSATQAVPPQTLLQAAHNAAMLQLAVRNFHPVPAGSALSQAPPRSWRATPDGPQAVAITSIRYGLLTDAAAAGPEDLGVLFVNVGTQTATTVHRDRRPGAEGGLFSTALYTSALGDGHPLLLRAPDVVPPLRMFPLGTGHALLGEGHPLLVRARLEHERRAVGPLVNEARPLVGNPRWRIEGEAEHEVMEGVARKLWGESRGRIRGGRDVPWAGNPAVRWGVGDDEEDN